MEGFIALHRKVIEWEWYTCADTSRVFLHLLLMANHKPNKVRGQNVARGQHITSTPKLMEQLNMTFSRVRKAINKLKKSGEIKIDNPSRSFSLVTIVKYDDYQDWSDDNVTQTSHKSHSKIIQTSSNNNDNNDNNEIIYIHNWAEEYRNNKKLINAVAKNNKFKTDFVIAQIEDFVVHRMNQGRTKDKLQHFNYHFKNYLTYKKKTKDGKVISNYSNQSY
tara:strand:+ start:7880 stop:8539 length:660 start_codon:yes stop_codon:yes gene_type:complete